MKAIKLSSVLMCILLSLHGLSFAQQDEENSIDEETRIHPTLTVVGIKIVKAKKGDTVKSLAERHGVRAKDVAKLNGLIVSSKLEKGWKLRIPALEKDSKKSIKKENKSIEASNSPKNKKSNKILIPKAKYKTVRAGLNDTIETLACRHNVSPKKVVRLNQFDRLGSNFNIFGIYQRPKELTVKSKLVFRQKVKIPLEQNYRCVDQTGS